MSNRLGASGSGITPLGIVARHPPSKHWLGIKPVSLRLPISHMVRNTALAQ